ncbi:4-hydroxy-tetrahydrodipicolinate synthase [Cyclobacteriaceae bacterium]|nr:4-hydroxy-tetrahydrodipicolinate synthase [Cyclobacteriaceae bacterium]
MRDLFTGVGVALITPFNDDKSIDFDALKNLLNEINAGGVDYLVVNGTTSEASTINTQEKLEILEFVKANNPKGLPIMYGIGANDTQAVINTIKEMNFEGISAILTVTPYYNKPSQQGLIAHYTAIADIAPRPVLLYNVPGRTGINMTANTTLQLAEHENIFGIKEASGDLNQALDIVNGKPEDFMLISGDDMLTVPMCSIGGEGVISVLANGYPKEFTKTIHAALEGDFKASTPLLCSFTGINNMLYEESNPVGIKEVLNNKGICKNNVRLPLMSASPGLAERIEREHNIIEEFHSIIA